MESLKLGNDDGIDVDSLNLGDVGAFNVDPTKSGNSKSLETAISGTHLKEIKSCNEGGDSAFNSGQLFSPCAAHFVTRKGTSN